MGLGRSGQLVELRRGGVVPLGGVGQRLLGGRVVALQDVDLTAEPLHPAPGGEAGVLELAPARRGTLADQPEHAARDERYDNDQQHRLHRTPPPSTAPAEGDAALYAAGRARA